jgi:hypothetical protein
LSAGRRTGHIGVSHVHVCELIWLSCVLLRGLLWGVLVGTCWDIVETVC